MKSSKYYKDQEKLKAYKKRNKEKYLNRDINEFNKNRPWTYEELNLLLNSTDNYYNLAKKLGRSIASITTKKSKIIKEKNMDLELGNLAFNPNRNQNYKCPEFVLSLLRDIDRELRLTMFAINHEDYESPFDNTGNSFTELKDVFEVQAYNWNDEESQDYNFIFKGENGKDIKISWYKYLGRDTTINVNITQVNDSINNFLKTTIIKHYEKCIEALKKYRIENENYSRFNPTKTETNIKAEWEIGNCTDDEMLYLNLKSEADMRFSRFHLNINDAQKLANDIQTICMNSYFNEPKMEIIRVKDIKENK